ncbi:MAG: DUF177 domain-containing protein [Clostridia bacterium]|nr:DUF177 domain-containing protein [Clostridia bacterium]
MPTVDISALYKGTEPALEREIVIDEVPEYFPGIVIETPFTLKLNVEAKDSFVSVRVSAEITFSAECARCGEKVSTIKSYSSEWDISDDSSDQDCPISGGRLDIDPLIDEMLYVNLPSVVLCRDDCKGLCQKCGKNLNLGMCECRPDIDPRMTAFAKYLDKNQSE